MRTNSERVALGVFVKNLIPGTYKTRLAADAGPDKTEKIYRKLLEITGRISATFPGEVSVFFNKQLPNEGESQYFSTHRFFIQKGKDLGEKMHTGFDLLLRTHQKAIVIGSDCPVLKSTHLSEAVRALDRCDLVLGPAEDGGYYLIGMKKAHRFLFEDIEWSSPTVLEDTLQIAKNENLNFHLLETLYDVDRLADWERYREQQSSTINLP
nr:TIGR04282 family arsenosugar biosynthesis glycosyltransferase [Saprospiraceae bacterium]